MQGFTAYFKVMPLFSRLGLWKYLLLTAAISLCVFLAIALLAYVAASAVMAIDWASIFWGYKGVEYAAAFVAFIAVIALGILLFKHIVLIATAPWMGKVAESVSDYVTANRHNATDSAYAKTKDERATLIKRSIRLNARLITFEMLLTIPLLLIGLVPVVNIGAAGLLIIVQSYFVGAGTLDFTLEERFSYRESVAFFNHNRWLTIGLGLGFVLLLFTAIGFLFAPAWSAAAGAYAFHQRTGDKLH